MRRPRQPDRCKACLHYWWAGGLNGPWCCKLGRKASKALGECTLKNLYTAKESTKA